MTITLTIEQLTAMQPCDLPQQIAMFGDRDTLTIQQAIEAGATVSDILWVAGKLRLISEIVEFADFCATDAASHAKYARYAASDAARYAASDAASYAEMQKQLAKLIELFGVSAPHI